MVGLQNPKEEAIESRKKDDFGDEVLASKRKASFCTISSAPL